MPQINRIRVNNVKYNFGTQFYDDFIMRFSCKNSIYDLANGGGKSVLMLLLLQNLIPNCTLDDKQPIEKLFRTGNASTTIHSLIEWKLDSCDVRNGFKYMTTGFCARKARETGDEGERGNEAANIEYFNYCIFYREFGENDIKNLPLSNDKERITYNGLKAYLRDLEKKDFGVEVRIFDRKGDYQNFISNYGLYESQWEIIRGINKTEGHVRTYFENSYKTTRKVIEDLLIEGIIEKSYNNRIRKNDDDDAEMAQTLLNIKDKLIELAKRKGEIGNYNEQIDLLNGFAEQLNGFRNLYTEKKQTEEQLVNHLMRCRAKLAGKEAEAAKLQEETERLKERYNDEAAHVEKAEIETEYVELEKLELLIKESTEVRTRAQAQKEALKESLKLREAAADYVDYLASLEKYNELKELILNRNTDENEILATLAELASAKAVYVDKAVTELEKQLAEDEVTCEAAKTACDNSKERELEIFGRLKKHDGLREALKAECEALENELDEVMSRAGIIVAASAVEIHEETAQKAASSKQVIAGLTSTIDEQTDCLSDCRQKITETDARLTMTGEELDRTSAMLGNAEKNYEHLEEIRRIYGENKTEALIDRIGSILHGLTTDIVRYENEKKELVKYMEALKAGSFPEYGEHFKALADYLKKRYADVKTGVEVLMEMNPDRQKSVLKACPQMVYAMYADESYEQIKSDKTIYKLNTGSYIIPIWKSTVFDDEEYAYENMSSAFKDMSFIMDEAGLKAELDSVLEDINRTEEKLEKNKDRYGVVEKDLFDVKVLAGGQSPDELKERIVNLRKEYEKLESAKNTYLISMEGIRGKIAGLKNSIRAEQDKLEEYNTSLKLQEKIISLNEKLNAKYVGIKENDRAKAAAISEHDSALLERNACEQAFNEALALKKGREERLAAIKADFDANYKPYYNPDVKGSFDMTEDEINAKAGALRKIISEEMGELADKERLLASYETAMKKCEESLKYRGVSMDEAKAAYEKGVFAEASVEERIKLKNHIEEIDRNISEQDKIIDSESAQKNRIEGGIEHAKRLYEEKYGEYVREAIDNPQTYVVVHRQEMSNIKSKINKILAELKVHEDANKDILLMEKDLERIIRNAGLSVPEKVKDYEEGEDAPISVEAYETVQKQYDRILKDEQKKRDAFMDNKQKLIGSLGELHAYELAEEIRRSVAVPLNIADVDTMVKGIKETNECIALERDNIEQGIRDMERIKDSFEERCIQICSNIRTELDRLPKLSRITLEDQMISMITLNIPYIKEELYKDRMSVYINETVSGAETFASPEDKLKYIRGRLTWKKLFSVIVTDMNSIKLCLYKREHIKDQSRYLRYEEAVGSTGQSQGIYIQFLIAIIHYISSINAAGRDTAAIGKTIFIDNPFGAAKDVYIWEPIFKLLKTNHVQLIVPARGATPAITGMFDVNYILGQKMVGSKQQTVVVDYRSQIQTEEMDYDVLEYEQTTLKLD